MDRPVRANAPLSPRRRRLVWAWCLLSLATLVVVVRATLLQGWLRPIRIAGASMADAFPGPHCRVRCRDCGYTFRCGVEYLPASELAVCPNCGCGDNHVDPQQALPGQRVLIDRGFQALHGSPLWTPVAFHAAPDAQKLTVKRIVAAGDGTVEIRDGNIYVNGRIQQKSLEQLRQTRILVHDDRFRPSLDPAAPARWRPAAAHSGWKTTPKGYACSAPEATPDDPVDWLEYAQWTCWPGAGHPLQRTRPVPIYDHYAYNQSLLRGSLHRVADVMLACRLELRGAGRAWFRMQDGGHQFTLLLEPQSGRCLLQQDGVLVSERRRHLADDEPWTVELALCDHRVLAAVDGVSLAPHAYELSRPVPETELPHIAVGMMNLSARLFAPQVYRDLYYLGPSGARQWRAPTSLTGRQRFVLGDNVPTSVDSRFWSSIDGRTILGPVLPFGR